jgi:hypothetical protein
VRPPPSSFSKLTASRVERQSTTPTIPVEDAIRGLFSHRRLSLTAPQFQDEEGTIFDLPAANPIHWPKPLGKRLCILDIDNRPFNKTNEAWNEQPLHWRTTRAWSTGILNHYLYAMIHGYTYRFVHSTPPPGRAPVWGEILAMRGMLEKGECDVMINMDADAVFAHLEVPIEWLLNRWNVSSKDVSVVMPLDPSLSLDYPVGWPHYNYDRNKRLWANPGFFTTINGPGARDILTAWNECPDRPDKFPGCSSYRNSMSAEMGAFANYVRYLYPTRIREVPCTEGNGYPEMMTECRGVFVRHYTTDKSRVRAGVTLSLARAFMEIMHEDLLGNKAAIQTSVP